MKNEKRFVSFQSSQNGLLAEYLKELEKPEYEVLEKDEELELIKIYRETGDLEAKQQLMVHNAKLVPYILKQYNIYTSDPMDLIQAGNVGLLEAIEDFDPSKGTRLGTYAVFIIRKHILSAVSDDLNKVYIPFGMTYLLGRYRQLVEQAKKEDKDLTDEYIIDQLGIKPPTLKTLKIAASIEYASMSCPIGSDSEGKTYIEDIIPDDSCGDIDKQLLAEDNHNLLLEALGKLTQREYDIVVHTYGFECEKQTAKDLAKKYGISNERVYQICKHARGKMKKVFVRNGVYSVDV